MTTAFLLALPGLCALLYFLPHPRTALRNYLFLLPFLPEFIAIKAGVYVTGSRISTAVFFLALAFRATGKLRVRLDMMDVVFGLFLLAYVQAVVGDGLVFVSGFLMDVALPYYLVRCVVRTSEDVRHLVRALLLPTGLVVALAGFQSVTGFGVFDAFKGGEELFGSYDAGMQRLGLTRADVGMSHYIMLGFFLASLLPMAAGHYAGLGLDFGRILFRVLHLPLGAFFSLSGGSFLVAAAGLGSYAMWPLRRIWLLLLLVGGTTVTYVEIFSNRGTLAILATFAATDGDSAWYRIRLPSAVFAKMDGHWWSGYGLEKPAMGIYNDITNHYLWWLMQSGLPGMLGFLACFLVALNRLYRSSQIAVDPYLKKLNWGLAAGLVALGLGLMSVSLFGQMRTYMFLFFSMTACSLAAAREERQVEAATPVPESVSASAAPETPSMAAALSGVRWLEELVIEDET